MSRPFVAGPNADCYDLQTALRALFPDCGEELERERRPLLTDRPVFAAPQRPLPAMGARAGSSRPQAGERTRAPCQRTWDPPPLQAAEETQRTPTFASRAGRALPRPSETGATRQPDDDRTSGPRPVATRAEGEQLMLDLIDVMEALLDLIEAETELVRDGRGSIPTQLAQSQTDLAQIYAAHTARLQVSRPYLRLVLPDAFDAVHRRHETFRALLQTKLTMFAAGQAANEGPSPAAAPQRPDRVQASAANLNFQQNWPLARTGTPNSRTAPEPNTSGAPSDCEARVESAVTEGELRNRSTSPPRRPLGTKPRAVAPSAVRAPSRSLFPDPVYGPRRAAP